MQDPRAPFALFNPMSAVVMSTVPDINKGPRILISCGICTVAALILVVLRIIVRVKHTKNFGSDDYCIVAAMVMAKNIVCGQ